MQLNAFIRSLPKDMLFVLRSASLVRSVSMSLGGTSLQRFRINAACAMKGVWRGSAMRTVSVGVVTDTRALLPCRTQHQRCQLRV